MLPALLLCLMYVQTLAARVLEKLLVSQVIMCSVFRPGSVHERYYGLHMTLPSCTLPNKSLMIL